MSCWGFADFLLRGDCDSIANQRESCVFGGT